MTLAPECSFQWDGAAIAILLGAIPLAVIITMVILLLYRLAIGRAMRAGSAERLPEQEALTSSAPSKPLDIVLVSQGQQGSSEAPGLIISKRNRRGLSLANAIAGITHATLATIILFWLNELEFKAFRTFTVWVVFLWPVIVVWIMTATTTSRQRLSIVIGYFILLLGLEIIIESFQLRDQPGFGELFMLWAIIMGTPSVVIWLLANRAWRSLGLIALFVSLVLVAAYLLGFQLLGCLVLSTHSAFLLTAMPYLQAGIILVCASLTWLLLRHSVKRYQAKRISDQMYTLNSLWLLVTAFQVLFQMSSSGLVSFWLFIAFAGYKLVSNWSLGYLTNTKQPGNPSTLLLLRVFGHGKRVRTLTDQVGMTWRHSGPINMIGGTDLATALLEPDELMAFLSGRLKRMFVANKKDLQARLEQLDDKPDPDGRYRINEFFCRDDTWQATVHALAQLSHVVLMDLRGFGRQNRGCEFELGLLLREVPLNKFVLLVDRTTHVDDLRDLLQSLWNGLTVSSPNFTDTDPVLHLFHVDDSKQTIRPLMTRLFSVVS